jgi:CDP-paratose 2-epimerase
MYECVLITGGAGFVGSSIALALRRRWPQCRVIAFDNLHRRGSELNLPRLSEAGVRFVHGDVRFQADLLELPERPELIVECSAEPSAQAGYGGSPEYLMETNLSGCFHCLELARRVKADFLFLSTSRVYPVEKLNSLRFEESETRFVLLDGQALPGASAHGISEEFPLDGPRSLYGMTKLASELMVREYAAAYEFRCVINRCGLIAGPWQMGKTDQGVVSLWMAAHYFRVPLRYIGFGGAGKQVRDMLHIEDLCDLVLEQIEHIDLYRDQVFNVGGGAENSLSLREMTRLCRELTGNAVPIATVPDTRPADVRIYLTDLRRISAVRGWRPSRDVSALLADIHGWLRSNEECLRWPMLQNLT